LRAVTSHSFPVFDGLRRWCGFVRVPAQQSYQSCCAGGIDDQMDGYQTVGNADRQQFPGVSDDLRSCDVGRCRRYHHQIMSPVVPGWVELAGGAGWMTVDRGGATPGVVGVCCGVWQRPQSGRSPLIGNKHELRHFQHFWKVNRTRSRRLRRSSRDAAHRARQPITPASPSRCSATPCHHPHPGRSRTHP
jgi:hypothetical protein